MSLRILPNSLSLALVLHSALHCDTSQIFFKILKYKMQSGNFSVRFIHNAHGVEYLLDSDGYFYQYHHGYSSQDGTRTDYYKCVEINVCRGFLVLKDGNVIHRVKHTRHTTSAEHNRTKARMAELAVIKMSENLAAVPSDILRELDTLPEEVKSCLSCRTKILKRIYNRRVQIRKNEANPAPASFEWICLNTWVLSIW